MLKVLPKKIKKTDANSFTNEADFSPKNETLNALLNYSKALQVHKIQEKKLLINLN